MTSYRPPLDGIRVLELGSSVAGPAAARLLGDFGADVLKIESDEGDALRTWGPPAGDGTSWWFKSHNRNKRFLRFDLHDEADRATVREVALRCDVLLENFRPGRLDAWGLGYDALRAENPRLVYASISGYGQDGPLADELAAMHAVVGILAALRARDRDGVGDYVDVSLLEATIAITQGQLAEYDALGIVRQRTGNAHISVAPSSVYPTKDGRWLAIGANGNSIFRRFARAIGRPELTDDPRFRGNRERAQRGAEIDAFVTAWSRTLDAADAWRILCDAGVPAGPVNSIADIVADEQVRARGVVRRLPDDAGNLVATTAPVARLRAHPAVSAHAARKIGADTSAVLEELEIGGPR